MKKLGVAIRKRSKTTGMDYRICILLSTYVIKIPLERLLIGILGVYRDNARNHGGAYRIQRCGAPTVGRRKNGRVLNNVKF